MQTSRALVAISLAFTSSLAHANAKTDKSALKVNRGKYTFALVWAPDGTWFLIGGKDKFEKYDLTGKKIGEIKLTKFAAGSPTISTYWDGSEAISPDGGQVVFRASASGEDGVHTSRLWLLDLTSGLVSAITDGTSDVVAPSWTSDGKTILYLKTAGTTKQLYSVDTSTKAEHAVCQELADPRRAIGLPNDMLLAVTMTNMYVTDLACDAPKLVGPKLGLVSEISLSPDRTRAAVVDLGDGGLWIVNIGDGSSAKVASDVLGSPGWFDGGIVVFPHSVEDNGKHLSELESIHADGTGEAVLLRRTRNCSNASVWTPPRGGGVAFEHHCVDRDGEWVGIVSALPK